MATLTWQDVAGANLHAPDISEATDAITRGIAGLGQSVQQLASAEPERQKAALLAQAQLLGVERGFAKENAAQMGALGNEVKQGKKEKALQEFGAAQSILEASARDAAIGGRSFDDFTKSDAYLSLSPEARAFGASHLSDAFFQGVGLREQRAEQARQESHWQASFGLQRQQASQSARESNMRIHALEKAAKDAAEARGTLSKDPETNLAYRQRIQQVAGQMAPLMRGKELYGSLSPAEAAKKGGMDENWFFDASQEAADVAKTVEKTTGKKVDGWMINQLLVEGVGSNWDINPAGGLDNQAAEDYLKSLLKLQDDAIYNQEFLGRMDQNIRSGKKYSVANLPDIRTGVEMPKYEPKKKPKGTGFVVPRAGRD